MRAVKSSRKAARAAQTKRTTQDVRLQCGLEIPQQLQWSKWQAGGEFIKFLCVKNVSQDVARFTYKLLPSSCPFSVEFPQAYRLSPGMTANIKVTFQPAVHQTYVSQLELVCSTDSIFVPLEAVLPASKLQLPSAVDFGCVPAKEPVLRQLPLKNVGDAPLRFSWTLGEPFAIVPAAGNLNPGQTAVCEIHFNPQEAAAYRASAACSIDNGELLTVQVHGMAKFPFLSLEKEVADLGDVVVGLSAEAFIRFGNHSAVPANFKLLPAEGFIDGVFSIQPTKGTLQPNEYSVLHVVYKPQAAGTFSCQAFSLSTAGGNKLMLTCRGAAVGPQLKLSSRVFSFGNVKVGQSPSKVLYLENCSDVPLEFEFLAEANAVFALTRTKGIVAPRSMAHTAVCFKGTVPGNFWQRLVCLVKDSDAVTIDALASCFDDKIRPPPLNYKHVAAYLDRVAAGGPAVSFELSSRTGAGSKQDTAASSLAGTLAGMANPTATSAAEDMAAEGDAMQQRQPPSVQCISRAGSDCKTGIAGSCQTQQQAQQQLPGADPWTSLFDGVDAAAAVTVSDCQLDFGSCSRLSPCEPRSFTVQNNTGSKLLVSLIIPAWQDVLAPPDKQLVKVFQAFPESLELGPHGSATVRVAFRPPRDGMYYCQSFMLLAGLKAMRSFRLVAEESQVVPPWCLCVMASGNTFANMNPEFSPKVSVSSSSIVFPPCRQGEAVHQTLCLQNHGDTPAHFAFAAAGGVAAGGRPHARSSAAVAGVAWFGPFGVAPSQGVLQAKSSSLVAIRFQPRDLQPSQLKLLCIFNHSSASSSTISLTAAASEPQLTWDVGPGGQLFFRPTCVGASSQRIVTVTNVSRVAVGWQWVLSRKLQEAVSIQPVRGVLRGGEHAKISMNFSPMRQVTYNARAALLLLPPSAVQAAAVASSKGTNTSDAAAGASLLSITAAGIDAEQAAVATEQGSRDSQDAEKLILTIVGEALQGALIVQPSSISLGIVHVGYPQQKTLQLVNQSGGVFRYCVELVDEAPGCVEQTGAACEFGTVAARELSAAPADLAGSSSSGSSGGCPSSRDNAGLAAADGLLELCWVDEPHGIVNARATKSVSLTLFPRRRGEYRLRLELRACNVPQLPPSTAAAARSSSAGSSSSVTAAATCGLVAVVPSAPGSAAVTSSSGVLAGGTGAAETAVAVAERAPLASTSITASARFPALLVTDVFCRGLPKQVAWQMLGIQLLNAELRSAVTAAELQALELSDKGSLTNDNAAALLPPLEVDLGVVGVGLAPRSFWVCLYNEGNLPLSWELHSYDQPQVELENWVEPARPLTDAERARAFILDNNIFDVQPRSGQLQPGENNQVCFTFSPVAEGSYQLPMFLRVKDGKQLQLQLSARAVSLSAQLPLAVRGSQSFVLAATPIGELEPPLQCYTLRNGGPAPLQYKLDTSPLQQLARQNYGAEIIKYAGGNPLSGEVPPGDVAVFNWVFQPLEAKDYSVVLPLSLGPAGPQPLLVRGRGYHAVQQAEQALPSNEEAALNWQNWLGFSGGPRVLPASQALHISMETMDLGVCLPASTTRHLLLLENTAAQPLEFVWDLGVFQQERQTVSGHLHIAPATGILEPGESRVCQFRFESGLQPQIFSGEVFCHGRFMPAAWVQQHGSDAAAADPLQWTGERSGDMQNDCQMLEPVEEIIAQDPPLPHQRGSSLESKLRCRLPLHLSMTQATCARFELLKQRYTQAVEQQKMTLLLQHQHYPHATLRSPLSTTAGGRQLGCGSPTLCSTSTAAAAVAAHGDQLLLQCPEAGGSTNNQAVAAAGQLLSVTVQGALLSRSHVTAGSYMSAEQQQDAAKLLAVADLLPPVEQPVSLLVPPGSMGTSAAIAAAAQCTESAASRGSTSSTQQANDGLAVAGEVLQDLLGEVWAEGEVSAAFENLEPAPVPLFAHLRQSKEQQQQHYQCQGADSCKQDVVQHAAGSFFAAMAGTGSADVADSVGAIAVKDDTGVQPDAAAHHSSSNGPGTAEPQTFRDPQTQSFESGQQGQQGQQQQMQQPQQPVVVASRAQDVLQQREFQAFADYVLDNALLGVLQEGGFGEVAGISQVAAAPAPATLAAATAVASEP